MIVIGIDPGLTGACTVLGSSGLHAVFDLPTMPLAGAGPKAVVQRKLDGLALRKLILENCPADEPVSAVIEAIATVGGQQHSIQTQGSLLRSVGSIEAVLECLRLTVEYVYPQTWKRFYGLIDPNVKDSQRKRLALERARALYPRCEHIGRAMDHNRAESMLIAHWYLRTTA